MLGDDREEALELPRDEYDVPIVLADHAFNRDGSFRYAENVDVGFLGDTILVNGAVAPRMRVDRRIYRLRFVNASNARIYDLRLGNGRPMIQVASDGGLLERPLRRTQRAAAPGRAGRAARRLPRLPRRARRSCCRTPAASRRRAPSCASTSRAAAAPRRRASRAAGCGRSSGCPSPTASRRWDLALATTGGVQWQMAGRGFDPTRVDVRPRLGTTELWQWRNPSNRSHPMHLHGMLFRVVERSTGVVPPAERGWKDTVGVAPGETVAVQPWFVPYPGRYVFHCHNLEHGDKAMMLQLEVVA